MNVNNDEENNNLLDSDLKNILDDEKNIKEISSNKSLNKYLEKLETIHLVEKAKLDFNSMNEIKNNEILLNYLLKDAGIDKPG